MVVHQPIITAMMRMTCLLLVAAFVGCQSSSDTNSQENLTPTARVLYEAQVALGELKLEELVEIYALAECKGPNGNFQTLVCSSRDGNVRFEQIGSDGQTTILGIADGKGWSFDKERDDSSPIDSLTRYFIRGHELHMIAYLPQTRFGNPTYVGDSSLIGIPTTALEFRDILGAPVLLHYSRESQLPIGFTIKNHFEENAADIHTVFENWEAESGFMVFKKARFIQGKDEFIYYFSQIDFNALPAATFQPENIF